MPLLLFALFLLVLWRSLDLFNISFGEVAFRAEAPKMLNCDCSLNDFQSNGS